MLCDWFTQHGHHCVTAVVADLRNAHQDVARFINEHEPDVVVYDVGMPYACSWDLLDAIRSDPSLSPAQKEALLAVYRSYAREQDSTDAEAE